MSGYIGENIVGAHYIPTQITLHRKPTLQVTIIQLVEIFTTK